MDKPKQVIIIRKDLRMRKGKEISQGAHASLAVFLNRLTKDPPFSYSGSTGFGWRTLNEAEIDWVEGSFTKIVVGVDSEKELVDLYLEAKKNGIICSLIEDEGLTEFNGVLTKTAVAIGPDYSSKIDPITKHLRLL